MGYGCLKYLIKKEYNVVFCVARADEQQDSSVFPSVMKLARDSCIPLIQPVDINASNVTRILEDLDCEIALSIQNNRIFRDNWIGFFGEGLGIANIHLSPLPRYSGFWPEMWAIWNCEKDFGVTMHYVARQVDTGRIIAQYPVRILETETRKTLYEKSVAAAFQMFKDNIDKILSEKVPGREQDLSKRTYCRRELPNDGVIDLSWEKEKIERFLRATCFYPFIGAKIRINQKIYSVVDKDLAFFKPHFIGEE